MEETPKKQVLKYRIIESTSEDSDNPLFELQKGSESKGWSSIRFCNYPQEILIQFVTPVNLSQINILSHEKKISSLVEFYTFYPEEIQQIESLVGLNDPKALKNLTFSKLGYIRMDNNQRSNYKAREFRKVYVESNCLYLKIILHKNYVNKFNVFNQVSVMSLEFMGNPIQIKPENYAKDGSDGSANNNNNKKEKGDLNGLEIDEISKEKIKILKNLMEEAVKGEDFDEAKRLNNNINALMQFGKKLNELDKHKKFFIEKQDFDSAKIFKMEIDKLKASIKNIDKQIKELNHYSNINISLDLNRSLGIMNSNQTEEQKDFNMKERSNAVGGPQNNKSFAIDKDRENSFSIYNEGNNINIDKSFLNKSLEKIIEKDEDILYEDRIIPALKKKLLKNHEQSSSLQNQLSALGAEGSSGQLNSSLNKPDALQEEDLIRGELENLDPKTKSNYDALIYYIGEENLRKIFSNQVIFKEEGLDILLKSLKEILERTITENKNTNSNNSKGDNETSKIINLIMKLVFILMKDKHPHVSLKTIDIFQTLLSIIGEITSSKKAAASLTYDLSVTDKILIKIKEKLGDPNLKIRTKAVDLYCLLLRQNLCDYNNLLSELLEDELKHVDTKKVAKSSKTIIGKLSIFDNVFDEIQNALADKRTDEKTFPFTLILKYVIENLTNSKSEIRKLARRILVKMYTAFGFKKIEPMLRKVDERELEKIVELVPEVAETLKSKMSNAKMQQQNLNLNGAINNSSVVYPISNNKSLLMRKSLEKKKSSEIIKNASSPGINANNNNNNRNNKSIEKRKVLGKYQIHTGVESISGNNNVNTNNENSIIKMNSVGSGGVSAINSVEAETGVLSNQSDLNSKIKLEPYGNEYLKNLSNLNINTNSKNTLSPKKSAGAASTKSVLPNKNKVLICSYCGKSNQSFINAKDLETHKSSDCLLFANCTKCNQNVEVRLLNIHSISECPKKSESKLCKRCKEPVELRTFEEHLKSNSCNPAKNLNSSNRCPLCHKDIPPYDKGFVQHLVHDLCPKQIRKAD